MADKVFWDGYLHWAQAIEAARDPDDPFSRAALLEKVDVFYEPVFIQFNVTPRSSELQRLQKVLQCLTPGADGEDPDDVNRSLEAALSDFPDFEPLLAEPNIILDGNDLKIGVDHSTNLQVPLEFFVYRKVQADYDTNEVFKIMDVGAPAVVETRGLRQALEEPPKFIGPDKIGAVIDNSIGFLNRRFRSSDIDGIETTRFSAVWLQSRQQVSDQSTTPTFDVQLGKILTKEAINDLINSGRSERQVYGDLNKELQYLDAFKRAPGRGTHGTAVADLVYGMDPEEPNTLSDIPLLAVQLPPEASIDTTGTYSEAYIVLGFRWLCAAAREIDPNLNATLVVNISYGVSAGAKDGSTFLEAQIAREIELAKMYGQKVQVVYAYGNSRNERLLAEVTAPANGRSQPITWVVHPDNRMPVFMEVRRLGEQNGTPKLVDLPPEVGVKLTPPGNAVPAQTARPAQGEAFPPLDARLSVTPWRVYSVPAHDQGPAAGPVPGRKNTLAYTCIALAPTRQISRTIDPGMAGDWTVEITNSGEDAIDIVLQIQRGDSVPGFGSGGRQSYFDGPYIWENAQRDVQRPLSNQGTNSRYTTATTSDVGVHMAGALRRTPKGDIRAPYSAKPADWTADDGPTGDFVVDQILTKGVRSAGTYSGTLTRLSGTSAAAALYTNKLLTSA